MTTTNIAEVLKLAAKTIEYDNDEKNWLEFRFKLENYLTRGDRWRPRTRRKPRVGDSRCCKRCYSLE